MAYYVNFIDGEVGYKTLTEARKAAIREYNGAMGEFYSSIDIYPNRRTNKPSGYVERRGKDFIYVSYAKRTIIKLNRDGTEKI